MLKLKAGNLIYRKAQSFYVAEEISKMNNLNNEFNRLAQTRLGPLLYNRFDQYVGNSIAAYGEFSEGEAAMFGQLVGAGSVVVEAGANICLLYTSDAADE